MISNIFQEEEVYALRNHHGVNTVDRIGQPV